MILEDRLSHCRRLIVSTTFCGFLLGPGQQAFALDRNSTMAEWDAASAADQKGLLESLGTDLTPSFKAREQEILACLNLAGRNSAHADLPVVEIAKACADAAEPPADSDQSKDI